MMKKITFISSLLAFVAINIFFTQNGIAQCLIDINYSDAMELSKLYENSDFNLSYKAIDTLGECRVESIEFGNSRIGFNDSSSIAINFPFLRTLNFNSCTFSSLASINLSSLPSLEVLDFYFFSADDFNFLDLNSQSLKSLTVESIDNINEPIPDLPNLPNLKTLDIGLINLTEALPNFTNLLNLETLELRLINLTQPLPDFTNLPNLKTLFLGFNNLTELVPDFTNLQNLESLIIRGSSTPNFSNLPLLNELYISGSNTEYPNFDKLPLLKKLHISGSTTEYPNFDKLLLLEELKLKQEEYTGKIHNFNNPKLKILNLSGFNGVIPNFNNLPLLNKLKVCHGSQLIGPIPSLENCPLLNINEVDFSCVRPAPETSNCSVSESDSLEVVHFYQATNGVNWEVNTGWLIENMTSWWGIELTDTLGNCRVTKMLIRGINDAVELPALNLPFLEELIIDYNNFTGSIPDLSNLTNLKILNLGANNFTGSFPDLSNLTQLEEINLSQNQLVDVITDYPNQPNLKILDVSTNQLTGVIPNFDNNAELRQLNVSNNTLTGSIPNFENIPNLNYLNVSNNQLSGAIPNFANLPNLYTLNLADNELTGSLPNFTDLSVLQSLFVEGNQLSGRIPNFDNLPLLEELLVCANNFEGTAPNFSLSPLLNVDAIDFTCLQAAKVSGYVYYDANENCIYDEGDITLPNGLISINNGGNYQPVDDNGYYEISLEVGTNFITFIQTSPLWQSDCEDTHTVTSLTINDITEIDFANQPNVECTELTVDIGTPFLRRCFKNTYTVEYCNQGTQPAIDAYIEIDFEDEIIPLNASIPYDENNNLLTFQLGEIGIGECGSFTVMDSVACNAPLSSTGCVEAHIYPDEYCTIPSALWDGANLAVNAFCLANDSVQFIIENLGADMLEPSNYKTYEEDVIAFQGDIQLASGAAKVLNYPASGATYRVAVEQTPGHPSQDNPQAFFEFCGNGNFSTGYINSQLLPDRDPFVDIDCEEIIGSYDPNDKLVSPAGVGDRNDIYIDDELTYKIRFQNTGNDTAFTVVLVDTLDIEYLDVSTLEVLNSSHPYTLAVEDAEILTFTFNDILLVDSSANEQASHGFVTFKIKQNQSNQVGDIIMNQAYIYFDYNEAIVTPRVFNTLAEPRLAANFQYIPLTVGIESGLTNKLFVKVYPNPASEVFYVELPADVIHQYTNLGLELYNIKGQSLLKHSLNKGKATVDVSAFTNGIYYYKLFSNDMIMANGKLLIQ